MDAVLFLKELARLCMAHRCSNCPITPGLCTKITFFSRSDEETVRRVEEWALRNPPQNREED